MQGFITDVGQGQVFNSTEVANYFAVSGTEASEMIQSYLDVARRPNSPALYSLRRMPGTRTRTAVWVAGAKVKDAKGLSQQYMDDIKRRLNREIEPSLVAMGIRNPKANTLVEASLNHLVTGLELLAAGINGSSGP